MDLRAVGRSENSGVPVLFGGHNLPSLDEIGLTDLPNRDDSSFVLLYNRAVRRSGKLRGRIAHYGHN